MNKMGEELGLLVEQARTRLEERMNCPFINQDCEGLSELDVEDYETQKDDVCGTPGLFERCSIYQDKSRRILRHLRKRTTEPQPPVDDRERYTITNTPDYSSDKLRRKRRI